MGYRTAVLTAALSSIATAALGQTAPALEPLPAKSQDIVSQAFSPYPLTSKSYLNWSDLPFTISVAQAAGYNDNILGLAQGQPQPAGTPSRGDFFSNTVVGAATRIHLGQQVLFADTNFGLTRYLVDTADNTHQYMLDAGIDWQFTSRCSGRAIAAKMEYQSPVNQQLGSGINTVSSSSLTETATCLLSSETSVIFDSGWSSTQNSGGVNALNDANAVYVRGGFQYSLSGLDTARALITDTKRQFTNRGAPQAVAGLADSTNQIDYQLFYNRILSPKLTFDGMVGVSAVTVISAIPGMASPTLSTPVYSAALAWQATPKLSFGLASTRSVGAPTSTLSNLELETARSATATYLISPKTSLQLGVSQTTSSGGVTPGTSSPANNGSGFASFCTASYVVSPFINATASYQYTQSQTGGLETKDNIYILSLVYTPH